MNAYKMEGIRIRVLIAIMALIGAWTGATSTGDAHAMHHAMNIRGAYQQPLAAFADCLADGHSAQDDPCCGASTFGCCAPCVLLPPEQALAAPVGGQAFAALFVDAAAGLPPDRLRRPPRRTG